MSDALEEHEGKVSIGSRNITSLPYESKDVLISHTQAISEYWHEWHKSPFRGFSN